jgi:outer membrane protein OmpA-like peptidoglycan-associated protein
MLADLDWLPSQRFVASGQVVEEAVARARIIPVADLPGDAVRLPMRVVAALNPTGAIDNLTVWVDWAALRDPHGVESARGAASALVALARARDERGLRVIESEPGPAPLPPAPREPIEHPTRPIPPTARVLWWRRHRTTLAGSSMALAAAAVIAWVGQGALTSQGARPRNGAELVASPGPATGSPTSTTSAATGRGVPKIAREIPRTKPTVQAGFEYDLQADLLFESASTTLTGAARSRIARVAQQVRLADVSGNIQVNGYTDSRGSDEYNTSLSRRRALAVAEALAVELEGLPVRLTPQGFGEDMPVATNETPTGRAMNRHVTVVLPPPS